MEGAATAIARKQQIDEAAPMLSAQCTARPKKKCPVETCDDTESRVAETRVTRQKKGSETETTARTHQIDSAKSGSSGGARTRRARGEFKAARVVMRILRVRRRRDRQVGHRGVRPEVRLEVVRELVWVERWGVQRRGALGDGLGLVLIVRAAATVTAGAGFGLDLGD